MERTRSEFSLARLVDDIDALYRRLVTEDSAAIATTTLAAVRSDASAREAP